MAATASELEVLEHYNRKILRYGDNQEVLLKCLGKLDQVRINIDLLQQTGIGKTVSALKKKYGDSDIGTVSRDLVVKWKQMVAREEEERENEEAETGGDEDNDDTAPDTSPAEYHPTPRENLDNGHGQDQDEAEQNEESSPDEDHHSRKSKKKKSHRERKSEERELKSDKPHKSKKEKEREKEKAHKHKHSDRDKEREDRHHSSNKSDKEKVKEHKSSKSSHRDKSRDDDIKTKDVKKEKCDRKDESRSDPREQQGDNKLKYRTTDNAGHSSGSSGRKHENQKELKNGSRSDDKHHKNKHRDLSSIDMFSNFGVPGEKESKSKKRPSNSDDLDDSSKAKQPRLLNSDQKYSLPSLPSSLSGPSLIPGNTFIPDISPIYKPLPRPNLNMMDKQPGDSRNDIDLSQLLSQKNKGRSAIYSGVPRRKGFLGGQVPSLYDQCIQVLKENVDFIEEVGPLGFDILGPVLEMATKPETLMRIEDCNPHLMTDTDELWKKFVKKAFYNKERQEMESWREMYERCVEERAEKLDRLKGNVKGKYDNKGEKLEDNHRQTKLAYVDIAPKAPRSVRNAQVKHGTALPSGTPLVAGPGAVRPRSQLSDPTANASRAYVAPKKPKTAPLMAKTFKLMRGIKGGFRR